MCLESICQRGIVPFVVQSIGCVSRYVLSAESSIGLGKINSTNILTKETKTRSVLLQVFKLG